MPPMMDRYGLGLPMAPPTMVCTRGLCLLLSVRIEDWGSYLPHFMLVFFIGIRCSRCQWTLSFLMLSMIHSCFAPSPLLDPMVWHFKNYMDFALWLEFFSKWIVCKEFERTEFFHRDQGLVSFQMIKLKRRVQVSYLDWMCMFFFPLLIIIIIFLLTNFIFLYFNSF